MPREEARILKSYPNPTGITVTFHGDKKPLITGSALPEFPHQLRSVVGDGTIICPTGNHSGKITIVGKSYFNGAAELINVEGDAFIAIIPIDYPIPVHGIIRTRDCGNIVGHICTSNFHVILGIHSSNQTEFGYHAFDGEGRPSGKAAFDGPITQRVLGLVGHFLGFDLHQCHVFLGPALGGAVSQCDCYEYTETLHRQDGTKLIRDINRAYPEISLEGLISRKANADKLTIQMGKLLQAVLIKFGILPENIHTENNLCTVCSPAYHSDRISRRTTLDPKQRPSNLSIISHHSN